MPIPDRRAPQSLRDVAALCALLAAAGCVTRTVQPEGAVASVAPQLSVERFLQAANEGDLESMARLFGTAEGPWSDTGSAFGCFFKKIGSWFGGTACRDRESIEVQMNVIADIIRHDDYRIAGEERVPGRQNPTTRVLVDLRVGTESASAVPFDVVRSVDGYWLIEVVGLEQAMQRR
jgi:hypothetical protein